MTVAIALVLLAAGAALLTAGAEAFAENVQGAATRLGVSVLAMGVLLAGAEPEETVTAMLAAGQGHPALAAGDAIGANLVITTLALGLAGLVAPLRVGRHARQYALGAAVAGLVAWLLLRNGVLGRAEGALLVLLYAVGVAWVWRQERQPPLIGELAELAEVDEDDEDDEHDSDSGRPLLLVLAGLLGMVLGGALAVRGAEDLVGILGLRESVIGLLVLGLATSAEMFALVWAAHRRGLGELMVAGTIGAVACNATITLGAAALVDPLALGRSSVIIDTAALTAVLPLVLLAARRSGVLPRPLGAVLVAAYAVALAWLLIW